MSESDKKVFENRPFLRVPMQWKYLQYRPTLLNCYAQSMINEKLFRCCGLLLYLFGFSK